MLTAVSVVMSKQLIAIRTRDVDALSQQKRTLFIAGQNPYFYAGHLQVIYCLWNTIL